MIETTIIAWESYGVLAFGYVKSTTPFLLLCTSCASVTFCPSFVSISPPNPSSSIVSPCLGGVKALEEVFAAVSATVSLAAASTSAAAGSSMAGSSAAGASFFALPLGAAFFFLQTGQSNWHNLKNWLKMTHASKVEGMLGTPDPIATVADEWRVIFGLFNTVAFMDSKPWAEIELTLEHLRYGLIAYDSDWASDEVL